MPRLNSVDRLIMKGIESLSALEKKTKEKEANTPAVGEVMYDRKRDARSAIARQWPTMSKEQRMAEIEKAGSVEAFMDFLGTGGSKE